MTTPNEKNLASGTIAANISASSTTILVYVGEGGATTIRGVWPTAPFYATIMPSNPNAGVANSLDSEIVLVTAVSNDQVGNTALTVTRGQRGTTTKAYVEGDIVTAGVYAEDAVLLGEYGTSQSPSPWIGVADIIWSQMIEKIYPVGSIFMSATLSTASAVGNALGGTWEAWGTGRVPVGVDTSQTEFNTVLKTGGEKTHTLVESELPKISGSWVIHGQEGGTEFYRLNGHATGSLKSNQYKTIGGSGVSGANSYMDPGFSFGSDGAHNNLQPYITCYMYKRTA